MNEVGRFDPGFRRMHRMRICSVLLVGNRLIPPTLQGPFCQNQRDHRKLTLKVTHYLSLPNDRDSKCLTRRAVGPSALPFGSSLPAKKVIIANCDLRDCDGWAYDRLKISPQLGFGRCLGWFILSSALLKAFLRTSVWCKSPCDGGAKLDNSLVTPACLYQ